MLQDEDKSNVQGHDEAGYNQSSPPVEELQEVLFSPINESVLLCTFIVL